ncbi:hypothetical protein RCL1_004133 [Eukaryota sp. TZLM3-RCL]
MAFDVTATVDVSSITVLLLIGIVVSFILQQVIKLFNFCIRSFNNVKAVVQVVYQELMTIGLMSFILFFCKRYGYLSILENYGISLDTELFDYVNLVLFVIITIYLFFVLLVMGTASLTFALWVRIDSHNISYYHDQKMVLINKLMKKPPLIRPFFINTSIKIRSFNYAITFLSLKRQFFSTLSDCYLDLFSSSSFPFAKYLRHSSRKSFVKIAQLHWSLWLFISLLIIGFYYQYKRISIFSENLLIYLSSLSLIYFFFICLMIIDSRMRIKVDQTGEQLDVLRLKQNQMNKKNGKERGEKFSSRRGNALLKFFGIVFFADIGTITFLIIYLKFNLFSTAILSLLIPVVMEIFLIVPNIIQSYGLLNFVIFDFNEDVLKSLLQKEIEPLKVFQNGLFASNVV